LGAVLASLPAMPVQADSWCRDGSVEVWAGGANAACVSSVAADPRAAAAAAAPGVRARVPAAAQAQRDAGRRAILEAELDGLLERERMQNSATGPDRNEAALLRTQADLRALRQELARLPAR